MTLLGRGGSTWAWRQLRAQVLGPACEWCGHRGDRANPLSVDHIVPRVAGGSDHPANLRTLCMDCNRRRRRRPSRGGHPPRSSRGAVAEGGGSRRW